MTTSPTEVFESIATFLEASNWFAGKWCDAHDAALIAARMLDPRDRAALWMCEAMGGPEAPKPDPLKHYDSSGFREHFIILQQSGERLARIADAWGMDNTALVSFIHNNPDPLFRNLPASVDDLLERLSIRAENEADEREPTSTTGTTAEESKETCSDYETLEQRGRAYLASKARVAREYLLLLSQSPNEAKSLYANHFELDVIATEIGCEGWRLKQQSKPRKNVESVREFCRAIKQGRLPRWMEHLEPEKPAGPERMHTAGGIAFLKDGEE